MSSVLIQLVFIFLIWIALYSTTRGYIKKVEVRNALSLPLGLWVGGLIIYYVLSLFQLQTYLHAGQVRDVWSVVCVTWGLLRWKKIFSFVDLVQKVLGLVILICAGLAILKICELDVIPLLAFGGIGAAAIGFAAKDLIGSLCSGVMLFVTRPFVKGDKVLLLEKNLEGVIEEIGWYSTAFRDKEKRLTYLPNSMFSNFLVMNLSQMTHRRVQERFRVAYQDRDKINNLSPKIRVMLKTDRDIDDKEVIFFCIEHIGEYGIELYLECFTKTTDLGKYLQIKERILNQILSEMQKVEVVPVSFTKFLI